MSLLSSLRGYANGTINENSMQQAMAAENTDDDITEYENDEQFMQECTAMCMPTMIQMMLMEDSADALDENVRSAFITVQNYLVSQGLLSEAATISISNPKLNVVHLSKQAQIARLKSILILKMGRKADHKAYRKYKLGQKIKMTNRAELEKLFGQKAERLAKKLWAKTRKSAKIAAVVEQNKGEKK